VIDGDVLSDRMYVTDYDVFSDKI